MALSLAGGVPPRGRRGRAAGRSPARPANPQTRQRNLEPTRLRGYTYLAWKTFAAASRHLKGRKRKSVGAAPLLGGPSPLVTRGDYPSVTQVRVASARLRLCNFFIHRPTAGGKVHDATDQLRKVRAADE